MIKLNPLTSMLINFRSIYGENGSSGWQMWAYMIGSSLTVFVLGLWFFVRAWPKAVAKL
ncbi:unannotated protein [freshwater metagenome]|uniref:Unannotated protein n=1 Tax=freshwater metagenome TaxID=449393 RepID=A0A6J6BMC5_9ZZZZ